MHIRVRKNTAQFIRTEYDPATKKGKSRILGTIKLASPKLDPETRKALTPAELAEYESWLAIHQRASQLREEHAALTLPSTIADAGRWFAREGNTPVAQAAAAAILAALPDLRRAVKKIGLGE